MSIYHFPINAISKKPILNSFSQNGIAYDVYGGRFDVVKDKMMGKESIRPQSCASIDDVIAHFKKSFPEEVIAIRIYDALFGKHYVLNAQGLRTEVETDDGTESPLPLPIKRPRVLDDFNIDDLVANSFFSPRAAIIAARKAESQQSSGQAQYTPNFNSNKSDETDSDINRFGA